MSEIYGKQHKFLQQKFDTTKLADRVKEFIVLSEITDEDKPFIESRGMFFLLQSIIAAIPLALTKVVCLGLLK